VPGSLTSFLEFAGVGAAGKVVELGQGLFLELLLPVPGKSSPQGLEVSFSLLAKAKGFCLCLMLGLRG
jgi:hypothetical protein